MHRPSASQNPGRFRGAAAATFGLFSRYLGVPLSP
jgi:hypothetical protein